MSIINDSPENRFLLWLDGLPRWISIALIKNYLFMSGNDCSEFILTDEQAYNFIRSRLTASEFPLRRVSRLLTLRTMLTFLFDSADSDTLFSFLPTPQSKDFPPFNAAQLLHTRKSWDKLCQDELSDSSLKRWLKLLQG